MGLVEEARNRADHLVGTPGPLEMGGCPIGHSGQRVSEEAQGNGSSRVLPAGRRGAATGSQFTPAVLCWGSFDYSIACGKGSQHQP